MNSMAPKNGKAALGRVLVVDDHRAARESVIDVLRAAGYAADGAASAVEALARLDRQAVDVVVTDLQMPGVDGLEFIRQINVRRLPVQIIMVTAHATIASAVEAMRQGAFDYLEKPFDAARLEDLVAQAFRRRLCEEGQGAAADGTSANDDALGMIGASQAMQRLRERIRCVAPTDETVLICGESGVGKELVARAVHSASRRRGGPLVSLNCPALSPQLAESELFGHRRGAFTGADADRVGRFEAAATGSLLLDEITEIELPLQAKLLRVLQERVFEPVGSSESRRADVRVLASTNRDLRSEIAAGRFREDLYFRLAVVPLELPPLREREDDVQLLADYFLDRAATRLERPRLQLTDDARQLLAAYRWPGNVRELENLITRACVLNQSGSIDAGDLRSWLEPAALDESASIHRPQGAVAGQRLEEIERTTILATLDRFGGNRAQTAAALGIGVRTLSGKLRAYGFAPRAKVFSQAGSVDRQILPVGSAESAGGELRRTA
jgi:DNA-binding NtrC family response regulator